MTMIVRKSLTTKGRFDRIHVRRKGLSTAYVSVNKSMTSNDATRRRIS